MRNACGNLNLRILVSIEAGRIISFKSGKEVGRCVGDSTRSGIEALYKKT